MSAAASKTKRKALMQLAMLGMILPLCFMAARPFLEQANLSEISNAFGDIPILGWLGAIAATLVSFAALGRYDVIVHRHLKTGVPEHNAQTSGAAAVALSQFLGFGLITGTIARWRSLPGLSTIEASAVTGLVSISFMGAWLAIFGAVGLLLPGALPLPTYVFACCLISALLFAAFTVLKRHLSIRGRVFRLPSLRALGGMTLFATIDLCFAALAFWLLIPAGAEISYWTLLPIYLAGLGLALMGATPGGLGPFEMTLLWAMQSVDVNLVLAGLIAFRCLYFAAPALFAALYLLTSVKSEGDTLAKTNEAIQPRDLQALHPESAVARQHGSILKHSAHVPLSALGRTTQCSVSLFSSPAPFERAASALEHAARTTGTYPFFYKISARHAATARASGWNVSRIARDAILNPQTSDLNGKTKATLRRKLRKAETAEIEISNGFLHPSDWSEMSEIDQEWSASNGGARGFSMGRYCPEYLGHQSIFTARQNGTIIAFVSFNVSSSGWALDLVRHRKSLPDGTMHALIWSAVEIARVQGCNSLSLASIPCKSAPFYQMLIRIGLVKENEGNGLTQFKRSFAPRWVPLYAAARTPTQLSLGLWDIWQEVKDPLALPDTTAPRSFQPNPHRQAPTKSQEPHNEVDDNEFAQKRAS